MTTLIPYKTMPVWDKNTIPAAVTNQHNTQAGTWGKLRVLAGRLKFRELTEDGATTAEHILTPESGVWTIYPQQWHRVEMLDDDTQMQLEFHCEPADYFHKKYGMTRTHSAVIAANETVPPGKALDLGCGQGRNALYLALTGHEVTASDYNPGAAEGVARLAAGSGGQDTRQVVGLPGDGLDLSARRQNTLGRTDRQGVADTRQGPGCGTVPVTQVRPVLYGGGRTRQVSGQGGEASAHALEG